MVEVIETHRFVEWLTQLTDHAAKRRIIARIRRLTLGNPGDVRPIGGGVSELRIHRGPGYRVYVVARGEQLVILLGGGTKETQARDIRDARALAREF